VVLYDVVSSNSVNWHGYLLNCELKTVDTIWLS